MPNLTGKSLAELRTMTPAEIRTAKAAYFAPLSKKQLIESEFDTTEFTDKPKVTTGEHGILTREQVIKDALGEVLRVESMEWTYFPTGEVDKITTIITNASGDVIDDRLISHSLTAQPVGNFVLTVVLAPQDTHGITEPMPAKYWKLIDIGADASLYAVDAPASVLLDLHEELWGMSPAETFGILAVASARGNWFLPAAVRHHTSMTGPQALARQGAIADYLDLLGHDTTKLRAALDEQAQMVGIVHALGFETSQLWNVMGR